jgi:hypothetical protein
MIALPKPVLLAFELPRLTFSLIRAEHRRRKQATIDLLAASPYLKRDLGLHEEHYFNRHR